MYAVTGISDHIGWAELVTLGVQNKNPVILDRRRVDLIEVGIPSAPYHHEGLELPLADVRTIVLRTRESVEKHCVLALSEAKKSHGIQAIILGGRNINSPRPAHFA